MTKLILSCPHGGIGSTFKRWLATNHPEIDVISPVPFPFQFSHLDSLTRDPAVRYFVNGCGLGDDKASFEDPYGYFDVNAVGVLKQLEMVRQNGTDRIRYLNLGSVYERSGTSPYSASKRAAREIVRSYRENHGLYALQCSLGFTESLGRADTYLSRKIVKAAVRIKRAIERRDAFEPLVIRDIDQRFVWSWADDVAEGMWRMLNQEKPVEHTLMSSDIRSVRGFIELAFSAAGIKGVWWSGSGGSRDQEYLLSHDGILATKAYVPLVKTTESGLTWSEPIVDVAAHTALDWHPKWGLKDIVRAMVAHELKQS